MAKAKTVRIALGALALTMALTPGLAGAKTGSTALQKEQKKAQKLLNGLKSETAAIAGEITALRAKIAVLEAPKVLPPALPAGPAGGDLTGSYPNPKIRANAISSANVADGSLTSNDIAPNTIQSFNLADGSIGSFDIADGSIGAADIAGGAVGAAQLLGIHVVKSAPNGIGGNAFGEISAACPPPERLLGGGAEWDSGRSGLFLTASRPVEGENPNAWVVAGRNTSGVGVDLFAYAICLRAG